jgi:tetratricopeptide (TPR) repeat protein
VVKIAGRQHFPCPVGSASGARPPSRNAQGEVGEAEFNLAAAAAGDDRGAGPPFRSRSIVIVSRADHWQELWTDPQGDGEILGGAGARPALEAHWRSFLWLRSFEASDCVLDVGAGAAPIARAAVHLPPERRPVFVCVDYAPAALTGARTAMSCKGVAGPAGVAPLGVAADARALPFQPARFAAVVSQFGLEYAGDEAFATAAAQVRPGGALEAVVHAAGGGIALECADNARVAGLMLDGGVIRRLRDTLKASYAEPRGGAGGFVSKKKDAGFAKALAEIRAKAADAPQSTAAALISRYALDMERMASRRFAFAPEEALAWLDGVERRLAAYRARMEAMLAAARSEQDMARIAKLLSGAGLVGVTFEPLHCLANGPIGAWRLSAVRPADHPAPRELSKPVHPGESRDPDPRPTEAAPRVLRQHWVPASAGLSGDGAELSQSHASNSFAVSTGDGPPLSQGRAETKSAEEARALIAAGNAAYNAGRFVEAADLARKAAAADPDNPWAHNLLGAACAEEMEHEESRRAFEAAVGADPKIALSHVNLAYAQILAGAFADAEAHLRTALAIEPDMAAAFLNLSWIHKAAPGDALIARLEDLRRRPGVNRETRALYEFALGKFYDDAGDYDRAFACFRAGNDLYGVAPDPEVWPRYLAGIRAVFDEISVAARAGAGFASDKPVFIVGMPRCGSSLLEDRLARHPLVAALGERPEVSRIARKIGDNPARTPYPDAVAGLPHEAFADFGRNYVEAFEARHPGAARFVDKNLLNHRFLGLVRIMLPGAAVIHCRRDALDTCLSCYFQRLRPDHSYKFSLAALGAYYRAYDALMAHWDAVLGAMIVADYEAFVENPDAQYARILSALGLDPAALATEAPARHMQTSSAFQARQPLNRASVGRWRNYEKHLGPLIEALGPLAWR